MMSLTFGNRSNELNTLANSYARAKQADDKRACERCRSAAIPLIREAAERYAEQFSDHDYDDRGKLADCVFDRELKALDYYDPSHGTSFTQYAVASFMKKPSYIRVRRIKVFGEEQKDKGEPPQHLAVKTVEIEYSGESGVVRERAGPQSLESFDSRLIDESVQADAKRRFYDTTSSNTVLLQWFGVSASANPLPFHRSLAKIVSECEAPQPANSGLDVLPEDPSARWKDLLEFIKD